MKPNISIHCGKIVRCFQAVVVSCQSIRFVFSAIQSLATANGIFYSFNQNKRCVNDSIGVKPYPNIYGVKPYNLYFVCKKDLVILGSCLDNMVSWFYFPLNLQNMTFLFVFVFILIFKYFSRSFFISLHFNFSNTFSESSFKIRYRDLMHRHRNAKNTRNCHVIWMVCLNAPKPVSFEIFLSNENQMEQLYLVSFGITELFYFIKLNAKAKINYLFDFFFKQVTLLWRVIVRAITPVTKKKKMTNQYQKYTNVHPIFTIRRS